MVLPRPIGPIGSTTSNTTTSGSHKSWNAAIGKAQSRSAGTAGVGQVRPGPWMGWPWPIWRMPFNPMTIVTPPRDGPNVPGCTPGPGIGGLVPGAPGPVMSVSLPCKPGSPRNVTPRGEFGPDILGTPPGRLSLPKNVTPLPDPWLFLTRTPPAWRPPLMNKSADKPPEGGEETEGPASKKPPSTPEAAAKAAEQAHEYVSKIKEIADVLQKKFLHGEEDKVPQTHYDKVLQIHICLHRASKAARSAQEAADAAAASPKTVERNAKIAKDNAAKAKAAYDAAVDFWLGGPAPAPEG